MTDKEKPKQVAKKKVEPTLFYFMGSIWDKDAGKKLCESDNGVYSTTDPKVISKLRKAGVLETPPVDDKGVIRFRNQGDYFKKKDKPRVILPEGVILKGQQ